MNANPMSAILKSDFQEMKLETRVIPYFHVVFTELSISGIIFIIQDHRQGQNVNFKIE